MASSPLKAVFISCRWVAALVLIMWAVQEVKGQTQVQGHDPERFFLQELMVKYGSGTGMSTSQMRELLDKVMSMSQKKKGHHTEPAKLQGTANNCKNLTSPTCLKTKCLDTAAIFNFHSLPVTDVANTSQVALLSPTLLYQLQNPDCYVKHQGAAQSEGRPRPSAGEMWGFGMLSVTIINICAALGILFYPIMKTQLYKKILMAMVGLAVGSLSASAILVLIPESLELMSEESHLKDTYQWRMLVVLGGVYMFFTVERVLTAIAKSRQKKMNPPSTEEDKGIDNQAYDMEVVANGKPSEQSDSGHGHSHSHNVESNIKPMKWAPMASIKPVAWMIVFGDALHNFVDGVSLGAAFSTDLLAGLSLSLAVVCEELPHELGDFAVLLSSGMGLCQAMLVNVASGLTCYVGLAVGIQVGSLENGAIYIFAIAAGMFLYISFVDMLPEMNEQAREVEASGGNVCVVYLLQNAGLLAGWTIILLLVLYGDQIAF